MTSNSRFTRRWKLLIRHSGDDVEWFCMRLALCRRRLLLSPSDPKQKVALNTYTDSGLLCKISNHARHNLAFRMHNVRYICKYVKYCAIDRHTNWCTDELTITYSMVQSPSWEANWFAASQEIPRISRKPKVHYRTHKRPPPVSILSQAYPVHIPTSHLLEIRLNIIHPSTPRSPQWSNHYAG